MLDERSFSAANICVVGNINRDIRISPIAPGSYLFADGETSVTSVEETVGGGGANSAFAAAALGAHVAFLGRVGAEWLGDRLERALTSQGISAHLKKVSGCPTGTSVNLTFTSGHRHFLSSLPNNASLAFEDLDLSAVEGFAHLLRADIWFSESMLYGGNERLFRYARERGMRISMDLNWDPRWGVEGAAEVLKRKEAIRRVLPLVDLVHGNTRELIEFADCNDLQQSLRVLENWGAGAAVAHLGAEGAGYYQHGVLTTEGPVPAPRQVNTTGTGDVLSVCLMLLDQEKCGTISEKLQLANLIVSQFIAGERPLIPAL
ncbi:MAG TPA: carbohydrate kinase family protein [Terriglobia bacterium]|nr:carbohydrate kinase family protein [Terriglobia bacterium]